MFQVSRTGPFGGDFNTFRGTGSQITEHSRGAMRRWVKSIKASVSPSGPHTRKLLQVEYEYSQTAEEEKKKFFDLWEETFYAKWLIDRNECFEFPEA